MARAAARRPTPTAPQAIIDPTQTQTHVPEPPPIPPTPVAPPPPPPPTEVDPFAAMGGGIKLPDGGWVPKNHPLAQPQPPPPVAVAPPPPVAPPVDPASIDPFAAMGGGIKLPDGGWVPKNHPLANPPVVEPPLERADGGPTPMTPTTPVTPPPSLPSAPPLLPPEKADGGPTPMDPATPVAPPPPTVNTAFKDALLAMLTKSNADPTLNDPVLKAQSQAYGVQQTRAKERARAAMAERFAGEGGPGVDSGMFDREILGLEQRQGEAQGAHDAGLLAQELGARRNQLLSAAALAGNQLNAEEARSLQRELANIDAEIRKAQLAQQGSQFGQGLGLERDKLAQALAMFQQQIAQQGRQFDTDADLRRLGITSQTDLGRGDLDLRRFLGEGNLNLGLLSALLQNQQFGQNLGANLGMFNQSQNTNYLQALLSALGQAA